MLRRGWSAWLSIVLVAVACSGGSEPPTAALDEHVVGGDLLLVMEPGEGRGEAADRLVAPLAELFGGAREGTANHVAWFDSEYGPVHVVTFIAGRDNPRGGEPEFCVMFGGGGGCGLDPHEPVIHGWGDAVVDGGAGFVADAYGGADSAEAVVTTESGNTVSVLTVDGYAQAEWTKEWGQPNLIEFYDAEGTLLTRLEFQLEE